MKTTADLRTGPLTVRAPIAGRVRLYPPRFLRGELEVFEENETLATVGNGEHTERIAAPTRGFLLRTHVTDGAAVAEGAPLLVFSVTG